MSRAYMPMYWGDYKKDTDHLTAAEHGAYLMLLAHYWTNGFLPTDEAKLCRISRMTPQEWEASRETISEFFSLGWVHARVEAELAKAASRSDKAADSANRRWLKEKARNANAMPTQCESNANASPKHMPTACSNDAKPQSTLSTNVDNGGRAKRATRLPENWVLPDQFRQAALERGLSNQEIERQASRMLNWSRSSKAGAKLDWFRTWLNWIDDAPRSGAGPPRDNRNGVGNLLAEAYGLNGHGNQENHSQAIRSLPLVGDGEREPDSGDDGGLPGDASGLLAASGFSRM